MAYAEPIDLKIEVRRRTATKRLLKTPKGFGINRWLREAPRAELQRTQAQVANSEWGRTQNVRSAAATPTAGAEGLTYAVQNLYHASYHHRYL